MSKSPRSIHEASRLGTPNTQSVGELRTPLAQDLQSGNGRSTLPLDMNRVLFAGSRDMLAVLDAQYVYLAANQAYAGAFGLTTDDVVGSTVTELLGAQFCDEVIRPRVERCLAGETARYQAWFDFPGTGRKYMEASYEPYSRTRGTVDAVFVNARDITSRHGALREDAQRLSLAQRMSHMGYMDWNPVTNEVAWSDETFRIHGYEPGDVEPTLELAVDAVHEDDREAATASLEAALAGTGKHDMDHRIVRPDGEVRWVHANIEVTRDDAGSPVRLLGTLVDITDRREAEEELERLNLSLEQRVEERTRELEEANRELQSFSYSVSHDLRGPLRAIDGFSRLLLKEHSAQLDGEGRRLLGVVREGTARMGQLITDLLDLAGVGQHDLEIHELDMDAVVAAVLLELEPQTADREIDIIVSDLPPAMGDVRLIRQVWANLLSNAVKFTETRSPATIEVSGVTEGESCRYTVRDNGVGFDMQHADKLFGLFQRLHGREEFEGTGVGLALVERIVGRHGGHSEGTGRVGEGATFSFTLPRPLGGAP